MPKKNYVIYVDKDDRGTVAIKDKKTGKFKGRKKANGKGDRTYPLRIRGKYNKPHPLSGQIRGRSGSIPVRGDSNKRGTMRERIV